MKRSLAANRIGGIGAAAVLAAWLPAHAAGDQALVEKHTAAAKAAAGEELTGGLSNCKRANTSMTIPRDKIDGLLAKMIARGKYDPAQVFDNLYFVGTKWVTAWAVNTPEGIILIDALNNEQEAKDVIEQGLTEVGLDPASIKKILVLHGHGDHYGGADYLHKKYGAEVIMSEADWQQLEQPKLQFASPHWGPAPKRGGSLDGGGDVTLGGVTITAVQTPGHTPGTLSLIMDVSDNGKAHRAMVWGGHGFNFGHDAERAASYIRSARQFHQLAGERKIDVFLSNHAGLDGSKEKLEELNERGSDDPNPFVIGVDNVERMMTVLAECGSAALASYDAAAVPK